MLILNQLAHILHTKRFFFFSLKSHNKFCEYISVAKGLSNEKKLRFSGILKIQGKNEIVT